MLRLDVSVGPVQGFVAQSRRTRDLWGSSYLLSFLSAHAMRGAEEAGGRIVQPLVTGDPLYLWVRGQREGEPPRIGSVPNHFVLEVDDDAQEVAQASVRALEGAWDVVCRAVWQRFVAHARDAGEGTREIWNRQVAGFWEVMWTVGPAEAPDSLLARRKHWRTHRLPDEPGDKCSVMHDLQELSGYVRAESCESRSRQDGFWRRIRERTGPLDLRDNERLSAVAIVKRLFPKVAAKALGWNVDSAHWPSTVYVGAVPWIRRASSTAPATAKQYAQCVEQVAPTGAVAERQPIFSDLDDPDACGLPKLDANFLHRAFVEDDRLCPLDNAGPETRAELLRLLAKLYGAEDDSGRRVGSPPTFYALLLADGDRLGRLVSKLGGGAVGQALAEFTRAAPEIVRRHDGVTIYAGGDDLLAMLPVQGAIACAATLSRRYARAFRNVDEKAASTLSAAVVFAHVRLPLGAVVIEAHRLLDEVAKESNGRSSLVAGVLKRGGLHCQWATTWARPLPSAGSAHAEDLLAELVRFLRHTTAQSGLSTSLLYRVRETWSLLCGWPQWSPGTWGVLPSDLDIRAFLQAEVLRSLEGVDHAEAGLLTDAIWRLLTPSPASSAAEDASTPRVGIDALLLARFLATGGIGEDGE